MAGQKKEGMGDIDKFIFEIDALGEATVNYNPKLIERKIAQLQASNTDSDKKSLSATEAAHYLSAFIKNPPAGGTMQQMINIDKQDAIKECRHAAFDDASGKENSEQLKTIGLKVANNLNLIREVAEIINSPTQEAASKKEKELIAAYTASVMATRPADIPLEDAKYMASTDITIKLNAIKNAFRQNPKLYESALNIPDLSSLGNLDTNATCKAITGKAVGLEM